MRSVVRDAWDLGRYVIATGIVTLGLAAGPVAIVLGFMALTVADKSFDLVAGLFKGGTFEGGILGLLQFCGAGAFAIGFVLATAFLFTVLLILPPSLFVEASLRRLRPPVAVKVMAFLAAGFLVGGAAAALIVGLNVFSDFGASRGAWVLTFVLPVLCFGAILAFGLILMTTELVGEAMSSLWNLALQASRRVGRLLHVREWTRLSLGGSGGSRVSKPLASVEGSPTPAETISLA